MGVNYSVMSAALATQLRKVLTCDAPILITARTIRQCTVRLEICASAFVVSFLVLPRWFRPVQG